RAKRSVVFLVIGLLVLGACRSAPSEAPSPTVAAIKTGVGVEGLTIKLAEITPLTGTVAIIGKPLTRGHEVYFKYVNDVLGGIGKNLPKEQRYKVELVTVDSQYLPDARVQPKLGLIYQDDDYGAEGTAGIDYAAKALGFTVVARASYKPTDTEFTAQVNTMKQAGADHVILTTTPTPSGRILGAAAALQYAPRWIGNSPAWIGALVGTKDKPSPLVPYMQQNLWVVTDQGCGWADVGAGCEGWKLMQDNMAKFAPDQTPDYYFEFGYVQAMGLHAILEKAVEMRDLTRDGLVKAFEATKT